MKVLMVAAEGVPFAKTGGLADVIGALPRELVKQGVDARVIMPKYGSIPEHYKEQMELVTTLEVRVGWRRQYCGIERLVHNGVVFYFVDNLYYFDRPGLYGYYDEAERYAYFCRAVLDSLPHLGFRPDVVHCHDWQAAMVTVLLKAQYQAAQFYQGMKTVFTIHNLRYQGIFSAQIMDDLLSLSWDHFHTDGLEFYGNVNFLKGALAFADVLTTVSETYAQEIQYAFFGERLDGLLRKRQDDLVGILNGIDTELWNPATDSLIVENYDRDSLEKKAVNKQALQSRLGLPQASDIPMIGVVSRLTDQKGVDLIARVLEDMMRLNLQLVVLGTGDGHYEEMFGQAAAYHREKLSANILFAEDLAHQIYAAADIFLMPSLFEPCGLSQLIALRYGTLPVVRETGGLRDTVTPYNQYSGEGNGFSFANYNAHEMLHTIEWAISLYTQKDVWRRLVNNAMSADYSWRASASKYRELYGNLIE